MGESAEDMYAAEYIAVEFNRQVVSELEDRILVSEGDELDSLYREKARQEEILNNRIFELGYI